MGDNKSLIAEDQIGKINLPSSPVGGDVSGDPHPKMKPTTDIIPAKPAPIDTVALMYPRYASDIQAARSAGYGDEEISGYFGRLEAEAALYYSPMQIDRHFQRTEESKAALSDYFAKSRIYGYYTARNGELSQPDIEERIAIAHKIGLKEAPLINDDKLYKEIKKIVDEPSGDPWWDYINKHILEPFKIRVGSSLSSTVLSGTGFALASFDKSRAQRTRMMLDDLAPLLEQIGIPPEQTKKMLAPENTLIRKAAKTLLSLDAKAQNALQERYTAMVGENPDLAARIAGGVGSSIAFMLSAALAAKSGFSPQVAGFVGAVTEGGLESLSEAGSVLSQANENGLYEEGIGVAQSSFGANLALNTMLNLAGGRWNPMLAKISNRGVRFFAQTASEVGEEAGLQEPFQGVIEDAALRTLTEGGNFYGNLIESVKKYPEILEQIGPETAGSTLVTQLLFAGLAAGDTRPRGRRTDLPQGRAVDGLGENAQPSGPAMKDGVQLGPTREAAAKLEAQTQEEESQAQGQTQVQSRAVDGLGENGVEEDTNVYLPAQAIESYNQENPGLLEDLGIVVEPVEGTSEVKLTAEQYEALEDVAPELAEAVKNDVRRGAKGMTTKEVGETLKKKAEKPAWRTAEVDGITKELEQEALSAGLDKAEARQWSKMAGSFIGVTSKRYNIAPSELAKMKLRQGTEETQGESFGQPPLNNDVDLGARVNVVKAQRTMSDVPSYERGKAFTPEMRAEIVERFQNGQVVNAHTGLTVTLSKSGGLDHVIHTSRGLQGEAGKALYQAIPYLDQLAREAYRVESHDDRKPSPTKVEGQVGNLKRVHRFLVPIDLSSNQNHTQVDRHVLLLTAKEYETGKAELDSVSLYDMKHAKKMSGHSSRDSLDSTGQASRNISNPDSISVRELVDAVNDAEGRPYLYAPEGEKYDQDAYNGSPALYDKFDMSKVGSGNGTASYGWGANLSSAREVAELYVRLAGGFGENVQVAKFDIPENDVLLSYDKRFSEQPQKVKDALQPYADEYKQSDGERGIKIYDVFSGAQIQEKIADALNEGRISVEGGLNGPVEANSREVSMFLNSLGIPGLRYSDDGGKGDNFVIWDENVMHMLEREVNGRTETFTPVSQSSARQSASGQQGPREDPGALLRRVWGNNLAYQTREDLGGTIAAINGSLTIDGVPDDGVGYFLTREALDRMGLERSNRVGYDENDHTTWPEGPRKEETIKYRALLDETPLDGDEYGKNEAILDRLYADEARDAEKEREIYGRLEDWYDGHLTSMKNDAEERLQHMRLFGVNSLAELYDRMDEAEATPASEWSPELQAFMERFVAVTKYYEPFLGRGPEDYAFYEAGSAPGEAMEFPTRWRGVSELEELFLDLAEVEKNLAIEGDRDEQRPLRKEKAGILKEARTILKRMHKELDALIDEDEARQKALWAKAEKAGIKVEGDRRPETYYQMAYQRQAEAKLAQDEKAWAETVDSFTAGKMQQNRPVRVMTTPIALKLASDEEVGFKEIVTSPAVLKKILKEKHVEITPDILKQLPRAMADPILVFKSATVPGSYVSMLELKDSAGGTIIVPVALNASKPGKQAFMTSVYSKGNIAQVNNQWFAKQIESGNLRYINTKKSASWARDVGLQLPIMSLPAEALHELNIPTEADLVKARVENPGFYQRQSEETENIRRGPLTFKLTGEPVSGEYMAALEKLEAGEPIAAEEYNAIPEIQDARGRTATGSTLGMPDREAIRKQVYDKLMSYGSAVTEVVDGQKRTVYNGEVRNDRRADIIIGLPASGKSSALVDPISSKYKSMLIDSDEAKKLIPEFDDGFGAGFVHEESKGIVSLVLSNATDKGENVVIPIVGSDYAKLKNEYVGHLRQKGYKVYVHMADINPNVAAGRNLRRFAETGRFVDLTATSFKYGNKPREVFERVKKEGIADGYSRIDTTVFPGRQVEGTEDISHDRGDLREGRGGVLANVEGPGEVKRSWAAPTGADGLSGVFGSAKEGKGAQAGAAAGLDAERAGGTSRMGTAPRGVSAHPSDSNGRLTVQPDDVSLIEFFKNANRSTSFHELAHHMFRVIYELSGRDGVDPQLIEDVNTILREAGVTREEFDSDDAEVRKLARTQVHEFFARGFEVYISEGKAPSKELRGVFRRLRAWMIEVYHDVVQALGIELSDEMRGVYDRLLAMPEEIDAETTVRELAVEEAALKEEIQRYEAAMREREAQERISVEGGEEWASLEIPEGATEDVDGWLRELESYETGRAARAEVRKTLDYIREEGGLNFERLAFLMGDEAAGELRKKLGNFYFTSKKALFEGRGLPLDVLAEALGMDENGLVAFLEGIEGGKLKKPAPLLEVNTDTLNALVDRLGVEGARSYLKDRARYLTKQQRAIQQEYDRDKNNAQVRADLEATYREQREIADGLRALEGTLKAEDIPEPAEQERALPFDPNELRAESGRSIEEAASHELLMTPEGAFDLGSISGEAAAVLGIPDSGIQANVGVLRHAEREHGSQIRNAGYENVQTFMLDVLSNWKNIYEGTGDSLWLVLPKKSKHGAVAAIRLALNQEGVYRVNTLMYVRERSLKNRKLLFAERPSSTVSPGTDTNLTRATPNESGEYAAKGGSSKEQSSSATVPPGKGSVNPMLTLSEAMRRGYAMAEKYARAAFKAGRDEATLKARERMQLLKQKLQERQALKKEVNKLVKGINKMAKSESISWARHKELEKLLAGYDLKKRRQETLDRRAELEEYLKENPEAADTMNAADLKYLGTRTLNDMTLDDLRSLNEQVQQIYDRGKEEYKVWDLERTERRDTMHSELVAVLKKRKTNLPKIVTKAEDIKKQYKGITGKLAKAKDWTYAATLGPDRFFDWLDKGATDYTGAFVRYLVDEVNKQRDVALRHIFERSKWMEDRLRPLGFRMSDFTRIATTIEGQDFTWDDIMEIYIGMRNDKKGRAILYGNLKNVSDPEGTAAHLIGLLTEDHKKAAELVVEDHNRNVDRIEARLIDAFQKGMDRETDYTSIHRLERLSSMGLIDAESAEALTDGMADAGVLRRVEDGFMRKRVEIKDENQTPIKLGLFSNWHEDVSRHEHSAAMASTARDLAGALLMRNPVDGQTIGKMVKERFGDEAWRTLVDFVNTNVMDDARLAHTLLDGMCNTMMKNMVLAYLAGNLGTVLKQTTSIPRFLITAGPHRMLVSIAQFLTQGPKFLEKVYEMDPQMRDRMGSPILTMLKQDPRWGKRMYQRGLSWMLAPISMMDRWVAAIGWKATYDANLGRLGHEGAVREAQRAVRLTQQPASAKDAARMWRQNGFVRLAMIFTSDAAQTFGMTAYDLVQQLRSGKLGRAFSTLTALALTGILMKAASEGLPGDEDDEDEDRSWVLEAFAEQFISSIPLVGKEAMVLYDNLSGKRRGTQYSAFMTPVEKAARAWRLWTDEDSDEEEFRRATWLALEAFSLSGVAPIPVTGMRRMVQSMELAEEDGMAAALNMVGIRRRE